MAALISDKFSQLEIEYNKKIQQQTENEEKINEIIINMYGLKTTVLNKIDSKAITLHTPNIVSEIKSLISYGVGCIFGRYNPQIDGIVFAGGSFSTALKRLESCSFAPIKDNCVVLQTQAIVEADILKLFTEFIESVYGTETLEENLSFISKVLNCKGSTPKEIIRNYFCKDFFADHCKLYQKKPIYLQVTSGKQQAFNALFYLHRFDTDTVTALKQYATHTLTAYTSEINLLDNKLSGEAMDARLTQKQKNLLCSKVTELEDFINRLNKICVTNLNLSDGLVNNYKRLQFTSNGEQLNILKKI